MFSNNQKISIRQIRRLLVLDLFGLSSLLLPQLLAETAGTDGVFCLIAGTVLAVLYIGILGKALNYVQEDFYSSLKKKVGSFLSDVIMLFYFFFFVSLAAFVLYQITGMVRVWLLPEGSYQGICLLLLLLAAYATVRGIEGRARIYEIIFWFLLAPLILMLVLASRGVNTNYWTPVFFTSGERFLNGAVAVFLFFLPVSFLLFLKSFCAKPEKMCKCARRAVWLTTGLNVVIYLILIGTFQVKTTSLLQRPVITLMSMVKLPGGFFARMDAFMTAIWFFSLFALMNTGVFYASHVIKELFQEKKTQYGLLAVLVLVYAGAQWFYVYSNAEEVYGCYLKYLAMPVLLIIPLLIWFRGYLQERKARKQTR